MVGTAGFEPTASCTPSKRATRLRHVPKRTKNQYLFSNITINHCQQLLGKESKPADGFT